MNSSKASWVKYGIAIKHRACHGLWVLYDLGCESVSLVNLAFLVSLAVHCLQISWVGPLREVTFPVSGLWVIFLPRDPHPWWPSPLWEHDLPALATHSIKWPLIGIFKCDGFFVLSPMRTAWPCSVLVPHVNPIHMLGPLGSLYNMSLPPSPTPCSNRLTY